MSDELKKEILGVGLFGIFLFLLVSLLSYYPFDPSLNAVAAGRVHNLCGRAGSYTSDLLIQLFGIMSYAFALFLLVFAFLFVKKQPFRNVLLLAAGSLLFFLSLSILLQFFVGKIQVRGVTIPFSGLLGVLLERALLYVLGYFGSLLLGFFLFFISLFLMFQEPLVQVVQGWLHREKPVQRPKEVRVVQAPEPREEPKKERKPAAVQDAFEFLKEIGPYKVPVVSLLDATERKEIKVDRESVQANARMLEKKLKDYGIEGKVTEAHPGPVVTMYEFEPAPGIKVSRIANLSDDLAMALSAVSIRIIAPIPGKAVVGIEVPNRVRQTVYLRDIIESDVFQSSRAFLTLALGKTIAGDPFVAELTRMPHLLVAGSTGSGKSVSLNSMICSILFKATPTNVRFLMIDLKMLELSLYDGIPHLLLEVIKTAKNAKLALRWLIDEMERRYAVMAEKGVRNIDKYNQKVVKEEGQTFPYIVVVIDELADLMMVSSREVEEYIARLAQMARASGIHLILATQRPSVDVLTGIIKANFPARISFQVSAKVDSRTILDTNGAESLLGFGDMLFLSPGLGRLQRIHGPFVSEGEIRRVVEFLKVQGKPSYQQEILEEKDQDQDEGEGMEDEKYQEAVEYVQSRGEASISMVQRKLRIGYNRAARMIERMEHEGIVGPSTGIKPREVLRRNE